MTWKIKVQDLLQCNMQRQQNQLNANLGTTYSQGNKIIFTSTQFEILLTSEIKVM